MKRTSKVTIDLRIRQKGALIWYQSDIRDARSFHRLGGEHIVFSEQIYNVFCLINEQTSKGSMNEKTKKVMMSPKILKLKSLSQLKNKRIKKLGRIPSDNNIIHINKQVHQNSTLPENEQ